MARKSGLLVAVLLDAEDIELLGSRRLSIGSHGYAQMWERKTVTLVHRWVLGLASGDRRIGDHINGNKLDNRRSNLRIVDASGSSQNVSGRGRSRFRGVYLTRQGRWQAKVKFQGRLYCLGVFDTEEEAAVVADAKRRELMPYYVPR
ncbi:HNH endonuclease [Streptomyces sp. NPDC052535]|uniref:HNH endonuclease n=1 Tax=Streptomyces sp. NPDC052535 TaxID=3155531 RepID=UPI003442D24A